MIQLSSPRRVTPESWTVPRLREQYSRMVLRSPISSRVGSPLYFLSWFASPIEQKWKMRLSRPMRVWPVSTFVRADRRALAHLHVAVDDRVRPDAHAGT
jgi:hypothetical protein